MATIKLCLRQLNAKGNVNTKVSFTVETEKTDEIKPIVNILADRLFGVFAIQAKIAEKGGKNKMFKISKGGKWYVDIDVTEANEISTIVAGLEFKFTDLGTEQPKEVLQDVFEAWVLLNTTAKL